MSKFSQYLRPINDHIPFKGTHAVMSEYEGQNKFYSTAKVNCAPLVMAASYIRRACLQTEA